MWYFEIRAFHLPVGYTALDRMPKPNEIEKQIAKNPLFEVTYQFTINAQILFLVQTQAQRDASSQEEI